MSIKDTILHHDEVKIHDTDIAVDIKNLTVYYELEEETVKAVNDVTFQIKKGHTLGLVGETGAGKTTTALAMMHLLPEPPSKVKSGTLEIFGNDMINMPQRQLEKFRGSEIAMIFQDPMTSLNPVYPIGEQIAESIRLHQPVTKAEAWDLAGDMLERVGIPRERASEYPHQFSGGMKQRVIIAIALCCNPHVLIADEPTTALDVTIQAQVLDLMRELRKEFDTTMLMITHDLGIVAEICDEVAVMYAGHIVEAGTLEDIYNHTQHPYTEGLFNSIPNINERVSRLTPIPGLMPNPADLPEGCPFAPRCKYATDACREQKPTLHQVSDTHRVYCTAYDDPNFHIDRKERT